jgi:hypothetical protein
MEQLVKKFCNDLRRLYEIESPAKNKYVHKNNDALLSVFGAGPALADRIRNVSLIANWFDSHKPLGKIKRSAANYAAASQCRWIMPDADIVLKGSKEFADQYGVTESTMLWLEHQDLLEHLKDEAPSIDLADGPTFDSKMLLAQELLPESKKNVRQSQNSYVPTGNRRSLLSADSLTASQIYTLRWSVDGVSFWLRSYCTRRPSPGKRSH